MDREKEPMGPSRQLACLAVAAALTLALVGVASPEPFGEPGEVQWWDLLTEDASAASRFYSALFGWEIEPGPRGNLVARLAGVPLAGISEIEDALPGVSEAQWLVGITVSDVESSLAAARRLGARNHRDGRVEGYGRWAAFQDPQGAPVMLVVPEQGLGRVKGPGAWVWAELWTRDPVASAEFYGRVVGYERNEVERPAGAYPVLRTAGVPRAGLVPIEHESIQTAWAPYVGVASLEATLARVKALGGRVLMQRKEGVGAGRVALLADPTGGAFFVYELDEEATS
jgi:predicted enzyme related to lactoylglutathione lyase